MAKILIATPTSDDDVKRTYAFSLAKLTAHLAKGGIGHELASVQGSVLREQRDTLAHIFLNENTFTHLLFIDSDMSFPPDLCERYIEFDKDIVGAIYPRRTFSFSRFQNGLSRGLRFEQAAALSHDYVWRPKDDTIDLSQPIVSVSGLGMGFTLVTRSCLEQIITFGNVAKYILRDEAGTLGYNFFREVSDGHGGLFPEDYSFCVRAAEAGCQLWGDPHTIVGHTGTMEFKMPLSAWVQAQPEARLVTVNPPKTLLWTR